MSQSPSNQVVALTLNVESHVTSTQYYERIIVTNETADDVYVRTDGGTVAKTLGNFGGVVLPGAWRMMGNDQPRQPLVTQAEGSTTQNKGFQGATTPNLNPLTSRSPTYDPLLANASGNVVVD